MNEPAVSVLLPAYNAAPFVDAAINSVRTQTFADWEIVAMDDCSSDDTHARLERQASTDKRIRPTRCETRAGMTGNWNRCLAAARGKFVIKLDADDVFRPKTLELLSESMRQPRFVGAAVRTLISDDNLEPIGSTPGDLALLNSGIDPFADHDLDTTLWMNIASMGHQLWHSSALMTRREWLVGTGGFDGRLGCASDTEFQLRLLRENGMVAHRGYVGCYYRQTPGSVSRVFRDRQWLEWESLAVYLSNLVKSPPTSRAGRMWHVNLWTRWNEGRRSNAFQEEIPQEVRRGVEDLLQDASPPPLRDRLRFAVRRFGAKAGM